MGVTCTTGRLKPLGADGDRGRVLTEFRGSRGGRPEMRGTQQRKPNSGAREIEGQAYLPFTFAQLELTMFEHSPFGDWV